MIRRRKSQITDYDETEQMEKLAKNVLLDGRHLLFCKGKTSVYIIPRNRQMF